MTDRQSLMRTVDLLVVGAGMAGLTAAARCARSGGSVLVLERAPVPGGSAQYAGFAWTAADGDVMREVNPAGDPALAQALLQDFPAAVQWLRELRVPCGPAVTVLRYGRGHQFDPAIYIDACRRLVERAGSELWFGAELIGLDQHEGEVVGGRVRDADGKQWTVRARHTLLATGGFQADGDLRAEHIHPNARDLRLRSNPCSDGTGLRLGLAAGGAFGKPDAGFYGHLVPAGVVLDDPRLFVEVALYYSEHAVLVDLDGTRFVDETVGDHLTTMALVERREARGLLIADAVTYRDWICGAYVEGISGFDKFDRCMRRGARGAVVDSLDEFDLMPPEWGYPGERVREEITRLNAGLASREPVHPSRAFDARPLDTPPYYVIEAVPAITFSLGGLLIDERARVRRPDGGVVAGLLCAGADAGGLYRGAYAGGIAPALVFGLRAAATASG